MVFDHNLSSKPVYCALYEIIHKITNATTFHTLIFLSKPPLAFSYALPGHIKMKLCASTSLLYKHYRLPYNHLKYPHSGVGTGRIRALETIYSR